MWAAAEAAAAGVGTRLLGRLWLLPILGGLQLVLVSDYVRRRGP
jgi:hypothetical protein